MTAAWDRRYSLQVDTLLVRELNVSFSVERTLRRRPGRCEIKVWNLSRSHRRQLEQLPAGRIFVELSAGFVDEMPLIFRGELHRATTVVAGQDAITTIRSRDGHAAHGARVSRSHRPGVGWGSVVRDVVSAMGIGEGNLADVISTATMGGLSTFARGVTLRGDAPAELDRFMRSADLEWSIQGGALQVLPRGGSLTRPAVRLAPGTGLVGSPARNEKGKLIVDAKIVGGLVPGALVRVESADHEGTFRIEQASYKGELYGKDWGVQLTCAEPRRRAA